MLIVKKSWNDPLWPSSQPNWPGGQRDQGHGKVLYDQGEGYQQPITFSYTKASKSSPGGQWDQGHQMSNNFSFRWSYL